MHTDLRVFSLFLLRIERLFVDFLHTIMKMKMPPLLLSLLLLPFLPLLANAWTGVSPMDGGNPMKGRVSSSSSSAARGTPLFFISGREETQVPQEIDSVLNGIALSQPEQQPQQLQQLPQTKKCSGPLITLNDKYVLLDSGKESPTGKSRIFTARETCPFSGQLQHDGEVLIIKFSQHRELLEREVTNMERLNRELFVTLHEYIHECHLEGGSFGQEEGSSPELQLANNAALIMERGDRDLKDYLDTHGGLPDPAFRSIASTVVQCLQNIHSQGMVWTDLKSENLVLFPGMTIKGIDVESAIPTGSNLVVYTHRGSPPELAVRFLQGSDGIMDIDATFDIWSLGILLHEMATGKHYFEEHDPVDVATYLRDSVGLNVVDIQDTQLRDLIRWCLALEPSHRPTIDQLAQHPYFTQGTSSTSSSSNASQFTFGNPGPSQRQPPPQQKQQLYTYGNSEYTKYQQQQKQWKQTENNNYGKTSEGQNWSEHPSGLTYGGHVQPDSSEERYNHLSP